MLRRFDRRKGIVAVGCVVSVVCAVSFVALRRDGAPERIAAANDDPTGVVVVASFDFAESALVGEIYAQALEAAGIPARHERALGPRELVLPALQQGLVDVVPEYLGSALASIDPSAGARTVIGARDALTVAFEPWGVAVLEPALAQNQNGFAVTRATAERLQLRTVSDLTAVSRALTLGGPPECERRASCLPGLRSVYGVDFRDFVALGTASQRLTALHQAVVDVAVVFTTDASLATDDLVLLEDDRALQPVEPLTPVVSARAIERHGIWLTATLDAVSSQLTSGGLRFMSWRLAAGNGVEAEARGWLLRHGLVPRR